MRLRTGVVVVMRDTHTVQVGLANPVVLTGLTDEQRAFVASLEEPGTDVTPAARNAHARLVSVLDEHGLIDSDATTDCTTNPVRIHYAGALGLAAARSLSYAGVPALSFADDAAAHAEPRGTYSASTDAHMCAAAAAWTMRDTAPHTRIASSVEPAALDVVIGVADAPPEIVHHLVSQDLPHLVVTTDEQGVNVGPVVQPGKGPCARCASLWLAQRDAQWPRIALQCAGVRRPRVDPMLAQVAGAVIASQVLAFVRGGDGDTVVKPSRQRVTVSSERGAHLEELPVRPHPACGCGATGAAGDEVTARRARLSR